MADCIKNKEVYSYVGSNVGYFGPLMFYADNLNGLFRRIKQSLNHAPFATAIGETQDKVEYVKSIEKVTRDILYWCEQNTKTRRDIETSNHKYLLGVEWNNETLAAIADYIRGLMSKRAETLSVEEDIGRVLGTERELTDMDAFEAQKFDNAVYDIFGVNRHVGDILEEEFNGDIGLVCILNVNGENPGIVHNVKDMNRAIAAYKNALYKIIRDFLISKKVGFNGDLLPELMYDEFDLNPAYKSTMLEMSNYISYLKEQGLFDAMIDEQFLNRDIEHRGEHDLLDAVNAFMVITYFDQIIGKTFNRIIKVKDNMSDLKVNRTLSTGDKLSVFKYDFGYERITLESHVFGDEYLNAIKEMGKYSVVLINCIPMYEYLPIDRERAKSISMLRRITQSEFLGAFTRFIEASTRIGANESLMPFLTEMRQIHKEPLRIRRALDLVFESGDEEARKRSASLRKRLADLRILADTLNVLYSTYRALFLGDEGKNNSWLALENAFRARYGIQERFNTVDTILGVILSYVRMAYLNSEYDQTQSRMVTRTHERGFYKNDMYTFIKTVNNNAIKRANKEALLNKYAIDGGSKKFSINIDGNFLLDITVDDSTLLYKPINGSVTLSIRNIKDGAVSEIKEPNLILSNRQRLVDGEKLTVSELQYMNLLEFADDVLGTHFATLDGLQELSIMRRMTAGNDSFIDIIASAARSLMVSKIYYLLDLIVNTAGTNKNIASIQDFVGTPEQRNVYSFDLKAIDSTDKGIYYFKNTFGALLSSVHPRLIWIENLSSALNILNGGSLAATSFNLSGDRVPNMSPLHDAYRVKTNLANVEVGSAREYNLFARSASDAINRMTTDMEVHLPNGTIKRVSKMNIAESINHAIIDRFFAPLLDQRSTRAYIQYVAVADKSKIPIADIDLAKIVSVPKGMSLIKYLTSNDYTQWATLRLGETVGRTYEKLWNTILSDYGKIEQYMRIGDNPLTGEMTPLSILQWLKSHTWQLLLHCVDQYNDAHPEDHLEFLQDLHYRDNGNSTTLNELLYSYATDLYSSLNGGTRNVYVNLGQRLDQMRREFVNDLCEYGIGFEVFFDENNRLKITNEGKGTNTITKFLNLANIVPSEWVAGNHLILAKSTIGTSTENVLNGTIPENASVRLNPVLEAFFMTNVLVGNNLRLGSLGSEVNMDIHVNVPDILLAPEYMLFYEHYAPSSENITLTDISMALLAYDARPEADFSNLARTIRLEYRNAIRRVESDALLQQCKRAIPEATTIRPYLLGTVAGTLPTLDVAVIQDMIGNVHTPSNPMNEKIKVTDGQGFLNPVMYWLFDASLSDMRVGTTLKPFCASFSDKYGTLSEVKFGVMTITNDRMLLSENSKIPMRIMFKKLCNRPFGEGVDLTAPSAILSDGNGIRRQINFFNHILLGKRLFYDDGEGRYNEITDLGKVMINDRAVYYTTEYKCNNDATRAPAHPYRVYHLFDEKSNHFRISWDAETLIDPREQVSELLQRPGWHTINTIYELHSTLGGIYAKELSSEGLLVSTEHNNRAVANYINLVTDHNGVLVLKNKLIAMILVPSSEKMGIGNLNPYESWTNEDIPLRYLTLNTLHFGILLDSDEDPSNASVREATLMIAALSSGGVELTKVRLTYNTVAGIMRSMSADILDAYRQYIATGKKDPSTLYDIASRVMITRFRGDKSNGVGLSLVKKASRHINLHENHALDKFLTPFSDPTLNAQLIPMLTSMVNDNSFIRRFKGIGNVTVTAYDMDMFYDLDGYVCQYRDVLRKAREYGRIVPDYSIQDINERNRDLVRRYLLIKQMLYESQRDENGNLVNVHTTAEWFDPTDNALCRFTDSDNVAHEYEVSLDVIEDYYAFKENPINFIAQRVYGVGVEGDGLTVIIPKDMSPELVDKLLRDIESMRSSIRYTKAIYIPRNLRNRNTAWQYIDSDGVLHYMNVYDDYRIKELRADRQTLYEELKNGKYTPKGSSISYDIINLHRTNTENIMSYMFENELPIGDMSMQEVLELGNRAFYEDPKIELTNGHDMVFASLDSRNQYIDFDSKPQGDKMPWRYTKKVKVSDGSNVLNRIYAIDKAGTALYEVGREIRRPDVHYYDGWFILPDGRQTQTGYKLLDDNKTVVQYVEFLSRSLIFSGARDTLAYNINVRRLRYALLDGENAGDVVALIVSDIYHTGRFSGILFSSFVSQETHAALSSMIARLGSLLHYNKTLAQYINNIANVINSTTVIGNDDVSYDTLAITAALSLFALDLSNEKFATFQIVRSTNQSRIPGLAMLSFMNETTIALYKAALNQVAISHWEMLLQGTDKDNDHAWHMAYEVDGSGRFIGWSDLFDYRSEDLLNASMELPLPTPDKVYIWNTSDGTDITTYVNGIIEAGNNNVLRISRIADLLNFLDSEGINNVWYNDANDPNRTVFRELEEHQATVLPKSLLMAALRNFIASRVADIANSLLNDDNALIPTGMPTIKRLGDLKVKVSSMLNPAYMLYVLGINLMAKDKVGVAANATKGSNFWHYVLNEELTNDAVAEKYGKFTFKLNRVIGRSKGDIRSVTIETLPDLNFKSAPNSVLANAEHLPVSRRVENDLSEIVTTATDNAKDPKLVSLNANLFLDIYTFLTTIGVPLEETAAFMTDPVAKFISDVALNNAYNEYSFSLDDVITMARGDFEPVLKKIWPGSTDITAQEYERLRRGDTSIDISYLSTGSNKYRNICNAAILIDMLKALLHYDVNSKDALADIDEFVNIREASEEFTSYSIILGTLRGLATTREDWQKIRSQLQRAYMDRIIVYNKHVNEDVNRLMVEGKIDEAAARRRDRIKADPLDLDLYFSNAKQHETDEMGYRDKIIDRYNDLKKCISIFHNLELIPLYRATREIMEATFGTINIVSTLMRMYDKILNDLTSKYRSNMSNKVHQSIFNTVMNLFAKEFLASYKDPVSDEPIRFPYIEGCIKLDDAANPRTIAEGEGGGSFCLDGAGNIASFKLIFELTLVPLMQKGYIFADDGSGTREIGNALKDNYFIKSLVYSDSDNIPLYKVGLNMYQILISPKNIREKSTLQSGLLELLNIKMNGISIADWFSIYNLVVNKNRAGADRMTALFDSFINDDNSIMSRYYDWLGKLDYSGEYLPFIVDDIYRNSAPVVTSINGLTAPYIILLTDEGPELWSRNYFGNYSYTGKEIIRRNPDDTDLSYLTRILLYLDEFVTGGVYASDVTNTVNALRLDVNEPLTVEVNGKELMIDGTENITLLRNVLSDLMYRKVIDIEKACNEAGDCRLFITTFNKTFTFKFKSDDTRNSLDEAARALWPSSPEQISVVRSIREELATSVSKRMLSTFNSKEDIFSRPKDSEYKHGNLGRESTMGDIEYTSDSNYAVGNMSYAEYIAKWNTIDFPELPEGLSIDIHLSTSTMKAGRDLNGRIVDTNGHVVIYLRDNRAEAIQFSNYMKLLVALSTDKIVYDRKSEDFKIMKAVYLALHKDGKALQDRTINSILLKYIQARNTFNDVIITLDNHRESARVALERVTDRILLYGGDITYDNPFLTAVNRMSRYRGDFKATINADTLFTLLLASYPELILSFSINDSSALVDLLENKFMHPLLEKMKVKSFGELLNNIFMSDPEFKIKFLEVENGKIILKYEPRSIESRYGSGYDEVKTWDYDGDIRDYRLYRMKFRDADGVEKYGYYPSREYITERNYLPRFSDVNADVARLKAEKWVDDNIIKQPILKNSFIDFMKRSRGLDGELPAELGVLTVRTKQALLEHSLIEVPDFRLDDRTEFHNSEEQLFTSLKMTINDFRERVRAWGVDASTKRMINRSLDTPAKVVAFLYRINASAENGGCGGDRSAALSDRMKGIIHELCDNVKTRAYYIQRAHYTEKKGEWTYNLIPAPLFKMEEAVQNPRVPIVSLIDAISDVFAKEAYGGVKIVRDTLDNLLKMFPDIDMPTSRAFVRDDVVYINTTLALATDPLHEYIHIFLSAMKNNPKARPMYELMMYAVASSTSGQALMKLLQDRYKNISLMDLMEEVFAKLFSYHIMNNLPSDTENVFQHIDTDLANVGGSIFKGTYEGDIKANFKQPFINGFVRLNNEIASLILSSGMQYGDTSKSRRAADWIRKLMNRNDSEKIIEECN